TTAKKVVPFKESKLSKKEQVANMFDHIAYRYDFLNHFMSLNIDKVWRRKSLHYLDKLKPKSILDVAAGTADFSILATKIHSPEQVVGIDISPKMLAVGEQKVKAAGLEKKISLKVADSEDLPFQSDSFDAVTSAFGVRNFENLEVGLKEMCRV